jgi:hypothetical protein
VVAAAAVAATVEGLTGEVVGDGRFAPVVEECHGGSGAPLWGGFGQSDVYICLRGLWILFMRIVGQPRAGPLRRTEE